MSALDLTEAVEAAAVKAWKRSNPPVTWEALPEFTKYNVRAELVDLVAAAAPAIKAQVLRDLLATVDGECAIPVEILWRELEEEA